MSELLASRYADTDLSFVIAEARPVVRRVPIDDPVRTSFGIMRDRPAVFLRLEDSDGNVGNGGGLVQLPVLWRGAPCEISWKP